MGGIIDALKNILTALENVIAIIRDISLGIKGLADLGNALVATTGNIKDFILYILLGGGSIVLIIAIIILLIFALAAHIFSAIPVYKLSKKSGSGTAWWAWIPFANRFALSDIPQHTPLSVLWMKKGFSNRMLIYFFFAMTHAFGPVAIIIITALLVVASIVGLLGEFSPIIVIVALLLIVIIDLLFIRCKYLVLKDALNCFDCKKRKNATLAFIATVVDDYILHSSLLQSIVLYTTLKKDFIPDTPEEEIQDVTEVTA